MKANDRWAGFPDELRDMMILYMRRGNVYVLPGIINYLLTHRQKVEYSIEPETVNYLMWIDRFFGDFLYPFEFCSDLWKKYSNQLEDILDFAKQILNTIDKDKTLSITPRTENGADSEGNLVNISQNFDLYFCTLYFVQNRPDEYILRLRKILASTKRNIEYLLSAPNVEELYKMNVNLKGGLNILGAEYFEEPLIFLVRELSGECAHSYAELLLNTYAEYYDSLEKMDCQGEAQVILSKLREKAGKRLYELGRTVIADIDESISNAYSNAYEEIQELINKREETEKAITDRCY